MANPFRQDLEEFLDASDLTESERALVEVGADWAQTRRNKQVVDRAAGE